MTKGIGSDANPIDGDRIVIELSIRDGRIASVGPRGIVAGLVRFSNTGDVMESQFRTGAEAKAEGRETFAGCETARRAALGLSGLAHGKSAEEAFAITVRDVIQAIGSVAPENERCVLTAVSALRSALVDAHVAALAEATVEAKGLRIK